MLDWQLKAKYFLLLSGVLFCLSSSIPQIMNTIGRNTVCSSTVLLLSPNSLALQRWEWQNIWIPWLHWGNAPSSHSQLLKRVLEMCNTGKGLRFLHGLWVGNPVSQLRLARNWAPDLVQWFCAVGKLGGTIPAGWFLGSSEQGQELRQYCLWGFLLQLLRARRRRQWKSMSWTVWNLMFSGPSLLPQQLPKCFPKSGWISPIVKTHKHQ